MLRGIVSASPLLFLAFALQSVSCAQSTSTTAPEAAPDVSLADTSARDAQVARLSDELRSLIPACPFQVIQSAAEKCIDELKTAHPEQLEMLATQASLSPEVKSLLLRKVGAELNAPAQLGLRDEVARERIKLALARENTTTGDTINLLAQIKTASEVYYRRLAEGRIDDDELVSLLKKVQQPRSTDAKTPKTTEPKILTAAEIVSEYSRHNQTGSALQRLRAYTLEGTLKTANGDEQHLLLFKLRPDRFRLQVSSAGKTFLVFAHNGDGYWEQFQDRTPQRVEEKTVGDRRYLGEFQDPLFGESGASFERLPDGLDGDRKVFRVKVQRTDGTKYISSIDQENFHQLASEYETGVRSRFSDFREIDGVTFAFREETTDAKGRSGSLQFSRCAPNPGLVQAFFDPVRTYEPLYAAIEKLTTAQPADVGGAK